MTDEIMWPVKTRQLFNHHFDSTIWNDFRFRADDVVIATYAKSGTTWTQQIVNHLVNDGANPMPTIDENSPWIDAVFRGPIAPIAEACERLGLVVFFHAGRAGIEPESSHRYALPRHFDGALSAFPKLPFVLGHAGARDFASGIDVALRHENAWLDIHGQGITVLAEIVRRTGGERVLYGTDWPFYHLASSLAKVLIVSEGDEDLRYAIIRGFQIHDLLHVLTGYTSSPLDELPNGDRPWLVTYERSAGQEIDKTDGFLLIFERPLQAVRYALDYPGFEGGRVAGGEFGEVVEQRLVAQPDQCAAGQALQEGGEVSIEEPVARAGRAPAGRVQRSSFGSESVDGL